MNQSSANKRMQPTRLRSHLRRSRCRGRFAPEATGRRITIRVVVGVKYAGQVEQSETRLIGYCADADYIRPLEVIENYPEDKYGPSCLLLGFTSAGRPLHVACSYPSRPLVKIITLYEPDPEEWTDNRIRRESEKKR